MEEKNKKRGLLLTIWLVVMIITMLGTGATGVMTSALPNGYGNVVIGGILGLLNAAFLIFILKWQKWAFYALCGSIVFSFMLGKNMMPPAILWSLEVVILYFLLRSKWDLLK